MVVIVDGVAKTHQMRRCCNCLTASTYVSMPHCSTITRLAFGAFCLAIQINTFCESIIVDGVAQHGATESAALCQKEIVVTRQGCRNVRLTRLKLHRSYVLKKDAAPVCYPSRLRQISGSPEPLQTPGLWHAPPESATQKMRGRQRPL